MSLCIVLLVIVGCVGVSNTPRNGAMDEAGFEEHRTPAHLRVRPGDEIRWVDQRSTPVTVASLGDALDDVTCPRGFDDLIGRQQEMATIQPNETARLCFGNAGTVPHDAPMDSAVAGCKMIESGAIQVGA